MNFVHLRILLDSTILKGLIPADQKIGPSDPENDRALRPLIVLLLAQIEFGVPPNGHEAHGCLALGYESLFICS